MEATESESDLNILSPEKKRNKTADGNGATSQMFMQMMQQQQQQQQMFMQMMATQMGLPPPGKILNLHNFKIFL